MRAPPRRRAPLQVGAERASFKGGDGRTRRDELLGSALRPADPVSAERPLPEPRVQALGAGLGRPDDAAGKQRFDRTSAPAAGAGFRRTSWRRGRSGSSSRRRSAAAAARRTARRRSTSSTSATGTSTTTSMTASGRATARIASAARGARRTSRVSSGTDPRGTPVTEEARYFEEGSVRIHHVHADSLFDFRPRSEYIGAHQRKFSKSALEVVLDVLLQGSTEDLETMRETLRAEGRPRVLFEPRERDRRRRGDARHDRVYVAVIGVYTDLKVKTLCPGSACSTTCRTSPSRTRSRRGAALERHLSGLDFAAKVLGVEVIHGINDLVRFLGGSGEPRGREQGRRDGQLLALPVVLPGSAERARLRGAAAAGVHDPDRAPVARRVRDGARTGSCLSGGATFLTATLVLGRSRAP